MGVGAGCGLRAAGCDRYEGGGLVDGSQADNDSQFLPAATTGMVYTPPKYSDHIPVAWVFVPDPAFCASAAAASPLFKPAQTLAAQPHKQQPSVREFFAVTQQKDRSRFEPGPTAQRRPPQSLPVASTPSGFGSGSGTGFAIGGGAARATSATHAAATAEAKPREPQKRKVGTLCGKCHKMVCSCKKKRSKGGGAAGTRKPRVQSAAGFFGAK